MPRNKKKRQNDVLLFVDDSFSTASPDVLSRREISRRARFQLIITAIIVALIAAAGIFYEMYV